MNDALVQSILGFTLDARKVLEREADEQLQGIYGWLPDGTFTPASKMPAVVQLEEAKETRARLERFKDDEATAGVDAKAARKKLLREAAFTWLNRLVAFRMMEERRLIRGTISRLHGSPAYVSWVTEDQNAAARALHDAGEVPANPMGEGPRHVAYRRFLLWQCGELARDVSILFDPGTLASRLCPRPPILKQLVEAMNAENLVEAWQTGNEESIGWVYQAFNAEEKAKVFDGFKKGKKVVADQIAPATQVFTPRWVVRYLVENSLGRMWIEMHPDSRLKGTLEYYVSPVEERSRPLKLARDITFLDPCTGSMHFGLVAFDLFAEIYREELERAGEPGWPPEASVAKPEDIPGSIIEHNLHGIDIDLRAIQLSALTLLLRARTSNPQCRFTDKNLACANVEEITAGRLEEFVKQAKFSHPIYERILRTVVTRLKDSQYLGSLLRLEHEVSRLVAEERKKAQDESQFVMAFPGLHPEQFKTQEGIEEFFDLLTAQIERHLNDFVRATRQTGQDAGHFVSEASKGIRYLTLIDQRYDVVATNPPYIDSRDYSPVHKAYLEVAYPVSKRNLFTAFIERAIELAKERGFVAMISGQSFMFLASFEELRERLRECAAIRTLAQFDYHLFKERVDTAAFVFERRVNKAQCDSQTGVYFRLVRERDSDSKRGAFESALMAHKSGQPHNQLFNYAQKDFDAIPGKPWAYWPTRAIRDSFKQLPPLSSVAEPRMGMGTRNNRRFLRYWWEVGILRVSRKATAVGETFDATHRWYPYMKGGGFLRWYGNQDYVVNYQNGGTELKTEQLVKYPYLQGNTSWIVPNEECYFQKGITYSALSSGLFSARLSPGGFIFDVSGSSIFPPDGERLLGLLNSRFAEFVIRLVNPTVNIQIGDVGRIPVANLTSEVLLTLVNEAVELAKRTSSRSETAFDFIGPARLLHEHADSATRIRAIEERIDAEVFQIYGFGAADAALVDAELDGGLVVDGGEIDEDVSNKNGNSDEDESLPDDRKR